MTTATTSGVRHTFERMKRVWSEIDYAQQRLFEIRTGVPVIERRKAETVEELEALYKLEEASTRP
jgi:hypothetical protein